MSIGLIGTKIGMTREFMESGQSVPVTVIKVEKGRVLDVITKEKRGYNAVKVGFFNLKNSKLTKLLDKKVFFKNGAEGVFVSIIPDQKMSVVVKILDGNPRASSTAIAGMISELNIIDKTKLEIFLNKPIANSIGDTIGDINWVGSN